MQDKRVQIIKNFTSSSNLDVTWNSFNMQDFKNFRDEFHNVLRRKLDNKGLFIHLLHLNKTLFMMNWIKKKFFEIKFTFHMSSSLPAADEIKSIKKSCKKWKFCYYADASVCRDK